MLEEQGLPALNDAIVKQFLAMKELADKEKGEEGEVLPFTPIPVPAETTQAVPKKWVDMEPTPEEEAANGPYVHSVPPGIPDTPMEESEPAAVPATTKTFKSALTSREKARTAVVKSAKKATPVPVKPVTQKAVTPTIFQYYFLEGIGTQNGFLCEADSDMCMGIPVYAKSDIVACAQLTDAEFDTFQSLITAKVLSHGSGVLVNYDDLPDTTIHYEKEHLAALRREGGFAHGKVWNFKGANASVECLNVLKFWQRPGYLWTGKKAEEPKKKKFSGPRK